MNQPKTIDRGGSPHKICSRPSQTERLISNWLILIDSLNFGCSTTTRFRKQRGRSFVWNLFIFWRNRLLLRMHKG